MSTTVVAALAMVPGAAMMLVGPLAATSWWFAEMVGASPDSAGRRSSGGYGTVLEPPLWGILALYGLAIVVGYIGALLATSAWLRRWSDPARLRTVQLLAWTLPFGALAAGLAAEAVDRAHYRAAVTGQAAPLISWPTAFVVIVVAALAGTRAWAVRSERQKLGAAPEPVEAFAV